jgi:hypothetical protein
MADWKARTCSLREYVDTEKKIAEKQSPALALLLHQQLDNIGCYTPPPWRETPKDKEQEILQGLTNIYMQAFEVSSKCRKAAGAQVRWLQGSGDALEEENVDVIGSAGYKSYAEAVREGNDFRVVFGAFARPIETWSVVRKSMVLLGPFGSRY